MLRKQLIGMAGSGAALLVLLAWMRLAPVFLSGVIPAEGSTEDRLAYAVRWLLLPGLTLLAGIWLASRRGFLPDAIDGTRTPASRSLELNLRYNQNTLEQVVLAAIAWTGLSLVLPRLQLFLIPAMAAAFVVGRATFWIGYMIHPMGRAFGMVLTVVPTICAYGWLCWRALAS